MSLLNFIHYHYFLNIILNKKIIKMDIRILKQNMLKIEIVFVL